MDLALRGITKRFGPVLANDAVDLDIPGGQVLTLLGENGAGKSTLMKILYGFYRADSGSMALDGSAVAFASPKEAMAAGIGMVFQQFSLVPALTVRENLMLAWPKAPWLLGRRGKAWRGMLAHLARMAPDLDPDRRVRDLAVGERQLVELAKVLNLEARLVILDEPTSVLTPSETRRLWEQVRLLSAAGHAVVFITHKFEDVEACADRVAVMRQGRLIANAAAADVSVNDLAALMMGQGGFREASPVPPPRPAAPWLWIKDLSARAGSARIHDIDLRLVPGEIVGIAGVAGNGQYLLAETLAGRHAPEAGGILLDGEPLSREAGFEPGDERVAYIPEQPAVNGIAGDLDVSVNLALKRLRKLPFFPDWKAVRASALDLIRRFDVRPPDPARRAGDLSGGNIQKLVIARELSGKPAYIVACYPTMGLDLSAAKSVYETLFRHAAEGACVIWISEDLDDLLAYAHRIAVLSRGRIAGVLPAAAADRERIGLLMAGQGGEGDRTLARARSAATAGAPA
jgi:simple sugar transport system ATP-binding protein